MLASAAAWFQNVGKAPDIPGLCFLAGILVSIERRADYLVAWA
jgi:hypothetical protein